MHGSYRAVSGRLNMLVGWGAWDTFEPNYWPANAPPEPIPRASSTARRRPTTASRPRPRTARRPERQRLDHGRAGADPSIIDGTSNTLMVGECTFIDVTRRATFWAYTYASYNQSSITAESRTLTNSYNKCANTPGLYADQVCKRAFGSNHSGGLNFVMGDGSVRFVSYNVDINILQAMATMAGGEVLTIQSN